jgi:hypothetical protein
MNPFHKDYSVKDTLWVVEQVSDPFLLRLIFNFLKKKQSKLNYLRGPNTDIELNKKTNFQTPYFNINEILDTSLTSSYQQVKSILEEKSELILILIIQTIQILFIFLRHMKV